MAISYNVGTNTITVVGYTSGTPCNFTDIYNADVAGGWGVVTRQCTNQFCFIAKLQIGDGTVASWFADTQKQVIFSDLGHWVFVTKNNAHTRFGELISEANKATKKGCHIHSLTAASAYIFDTEAGGEFLFYSSLFSGNQTGYLIMRGATKIYNSIFDRTYLYGATNVTMYNVGFSGATSYGMFANAGTWDTINIKYAQYGLGLGGSWIPLPSQNVKNVVIRGCTHSIRAYDMDMDCSIINGDLDSWTINWASALGGSTGTLYRKYEFDLKVIDKDNAPIDAATVKIWDKDSTLVVNTTTNASGVIATQTITRGHYAQATASTLQEKSPHLIKITKAGYTTYEADFTLEEKIDWLIALQAAGGGILRNPPMTGGMV